MNIKLNQKSKIKYFFTKPYCLSITRLFWLLPVVLPNITLFSLSLIDNVLKQIVQITLLIYGVLAPHLTFVFSHI